jgi:GntR family transcriptional regulator
MHNLHLEKNQDRHRRIIVPPPLYVQIAENLLERIESNELPPGSRLPPERELSETLGVTRATVRQALNVLYDRGLIHRRQGLGTFVASPKIERQAAKLVPFTKGMERRGYKIEIRLVSFEKFPSEASLAEELLISVSDSVYFIHRVRLLNKEPVLIERLYVPASRFPELDQYDLAKRSLYEVMETEYGVTVTKARQSLEPVLATEYEAELLEIKTGAPLMLERRIAFDQDDRPVERARDLFRGDRFRFVTEIAPLEL